MAVFKNKSIKCQIVFYRLRSSDSFYIKYYLKNSHSVVYEEILRQKNVDVPFVSHVHTNNTRPRT